MTSPNKLIALPWQNETEFYDQHAAAIFSKFPFYHTASIGSTPEVFVDHILKQARIYPMAKVLDLGCGSGYLVHQLSTICDPLGISTSQSCISQCKQNYPREKFFVGNMEDFECQGLSHCLALESIGYADVGKTFRQAYQNLQSKGLFYLKHWFINPHESQDDYENRLAFEHYWKYIPHKIPAFLATAFENGFELVYFKDVTDHINTDLFDETLPHHAVDFAFPCKEEGVFLIPGEVLLRKVD